MGNAWHRVHQTQQTTPKTVVEPTYPDDTTISNLWYNATLRDKLMEVFVEYIRPWNVLQVFHKYNRRILVRQDVEFIKAQVNNLGDKVGSQTLLERLSLYEGWFDCLISTLKDREVMLDHVAQTFQNLKDDLDYEILNEKEPDTTSDLETDSPLKSKNGVVDRLTKDNLRLMIKLEKVTKDYERERNAREKYEVQVNVLQSELEASQSDPEYKTFAVKLKQLQNDFEDIVKERDYLKIELDESRSRSEQDSKNYEEKIKQLLSDFEAQRRERELANQKQASRHGKGKHKKKPKPPSCFNGHN